jgi:hypothetical protein
MSGIASTLRECIKGPGSRLFSWRHCASQLLLLVVLATSGLALYPAAAQTAAPADAQPPGAAPPDQASLLVSAYKATTYKIGTALTNMVVFSAGVGLVGGTVLTAFTTAQTWLIYAGNDYFWDKYSPREARTGERFDVNESAWRSTEKFLTAKPLIVAIKLASIYAWTGSLAVTLVAGTVSTVATSAVFYANNMGWDFYEWSQRPPGQAPSAVTPTLVVGGEHVPPP